MHGVRAVVAAVVLVVVAASAAAAAAPCPNASLPFADLHDVLFNNTGCCEVYKARVAAADAGAVLVSYDFQVLDVFLGRRTAGTSVLFNYTFGACGALFLLEGPLAVGAEILVAELRQSTPACCRTLVEPFGNVTAEEQAQLVAGQENRCIEEPQTAEEVCQCAYTCCYGKGKTVRCDCWVPHDPYKVCTMTVDVPESKTCSCTWLWVLLGALGVALVLLLVGIAIFIAFKRYKTSHGIA